MTNYSAERHYIGGEWVKSLSTDRRTAINPAKDEPLGLVALGNAADADRAVAAAKEAFASWSATTPEHRFEVLRVVIAEYAADMERMAEAVRDEIGAPITLCRSLQGPAGLMQLQSSADALAQYAFQQRMGGSLIVQEAIGVCGLITPWNWPLNQIAAKVGPALAAGCTMVLKPSEITPFSANLFAEAIDRAGVPAGVFNLVHGDGPGVGHALSAHPHIALVSFTGSTRAGVAVAREAAATVKRVAQELGGKSPAVLLDDAPFETAIAQMLSILYSNAGQTCTAPSRLLVPRSRLAEAEDIARAVTESYVIGDPREEGTTMGSLSSALQFERVQGYIQRGIAENARVVIGGLGRPEGFDRGCFARATVFSDVESSMAIAREEIFGPVMSIIAYDDDKDALSIANDSDYGLAAYVWGGDAERAQTFARNIRAGTVQVNGDPGGMSEPFGGYRMSGNGRERGAAGIAEYLETKVITGAFAS